MNIPDQPEWRDQAADPRLDPGAERDVERRLRDDAALRSEWEADRRLTRLLAGISRPDVSSNFTSRVLKAIEAERMQPGRRSRILSWIERFGIPRPALGFAIVMCAGIGTVSYYRHQERAQLARDAAAFSSFASMLMETASEERPAAVANGVVRVAQNFEAIRRLPSRRAADVELFAALE